MPSDFQIQTIEARHPAGERSHVSHFFLLSLSISHTEGERDGRDANTICNRMHWIILPLNDWFSQFHISGLFYLTYSCLSPSLILPWTLFFLSSLLSFLHFDWKLNVNLFGNFSHSHFYQLMRKTVNICNATAFRWRKCFNLRAKMQQPSTDLAWHCHSFISGPHHAATTPPPSPDPNAKRGIIWNNDRLFN